MKKRLLPVAAVVASIAGAVVLISSAAAGSAGQAPGPVGNTSGAPVTLTVSIDGDGGGWVTTYPAGIRCGSTCSAQFPDGTIVEMGYAPAIGSTFGGWSAASPYACTGFNIHNLNECALILDGSVGTEASVHVTFNLDHSPPPCTAPGVGGKTLAKAKVVLARTHCDVGKITYAFSLKVNKGKVISQNPKAHWRLVNGAVDLVVGKQRR